MSNRLRHAVTISVVSIVCLLSACSDKSSNPSNAAEPPTPRVDTACIAADANARDKILSQLFQARAGDTVSLCEGRFEMSTGLLVNSKRGITLKGAGINKTILNFANSDSAEGINATMADGLVLSDFTVEDTPGNGVRVFRSSFITIRNVRTRWHDAAGRNETDPAYTPRSDVGAYGLYPVETRHVLMEGCESHGASDAGIYVGQSSDVIVRKCLATFNVAGFEFENTYRALFEDNIATKNTGGFLIFDLPDLRQFGEKNVVRRNKAFNNNTENFAPLGNIVGLTPRGTGMLVLASDQLEIYDNDIENNDTIGIAVVNYGLVDRNQADLRYDFFPEGVEIHNNRFSGNGNNPQLPNANRGVASALPLLLRLKNQGRGADIIWDGGEDSPNDCTEYPLDKDGIRLDQANPNEDRYEARVDERGRPNYDRPDKKPSCKYNAWKFDGVGKLKKPENGLCLSNNQHKPNPLVTPFLNAGLNRSDIGPELVQQIVVPGSSSTSPHNCDLPDRPLPVLNLPYKIVAEEQAPPAADVARVCGAGVVGQVNWAALEKFDCPELSQYGLFKVANDPTQGGQGDGVMPYELNSTLFSDYSTKYRVIFLPPTAQGRVTPAKYQDQLSTGSVTEGLDFPVGTVIAKTFTFRTENAQGALVREHIVETRLLIKRRTATGDTWVGLPYIWEQGSDGKPLRAKLSLAGGNVAVQWDYLDPNPAVKKNGERARYTGAASNYAPPAALNCITCHGGDDRVGAAPIGPKARNLDRAMKSDRSGPNQLAFMVSKGWLTDMPAKREAALATMEIPGSGPSQALPDSPRDIHERVRAYLEINCMHCHNPNGGGSNSGLSLDSFRSVDVRYGICKKPVAAGRGSGNLKHDIVLSRPASSILNFRTASAEAGVRMPPIARSVVHGEAVALINEWVANSLPSINAENDAEVENEANCNDSELPLLITELLPAELTSVLEDIQRASGGAISLTLVTDFLASLTQGINAAASSPTQRSERARRFSPQPPLR